jgi:RsiW-degrading membrane proteinase PrsW (M82 family)
MNAGPLYTLFVAVAALVSVVMWIDYFRRIDVFEREPVFPLIVALAIGGITPYISLFVYHRLDILGFRDEGTLSHRFIYSIFGVGLNEESCKLVGVLAVFALLRKNINEPIDVLVYAGVTALGFSLVENFNYFYNHGVRIITSRSFYSALEHIINTTIIAYGFYRKRLFGRGRQIVNTTIAFVVAIGSHALFDFFLLPSVTGNFTAVLSLLVYLIGISFWIQMLNNANNYSAFFDYEKVHFSPRLVYRLLFWYGLTLAIAFINNCFASDVKFAIITTAVSLASDGFLFFIVILRVSRFRILELDYKTIKIELPLYITKNNDEDFKIPFLNIPLKVRGENFAEHLLTKSMNKKIELYATDNEEKKTGQVIAAFVRKKMALKDDLVFYLIEPEGTVDATDIYLLKPKRGSYREAHHNYPVEGLYRLEKQAFQLDQPYFEFKDLHFEGWYYLKPALSTFR